MNDSPSNERDIALDLIEMLETAADRGRLVGVESTIADVRETDGGRTIELELSSGQTFELRVRYARARVSS